MSTQKRPLLDADPDADGVSTTDYCASLPRRRWAHEAKGRLLLFPRTGLVVTPYQMDGRGGWYVAVVIGNAMYPPDGYCLAAGVDEIETAIDVTGVLLDALNGRGLSDFDAEAQEHAVAREHAASSSFARIAERCRALGTIR